eukprot:6185922-Pleurochrysis_carterae.AAC.2
MLLNSCFAHLDLVLLRGGEALGVLAWQRSPCTFANISFFVGGAYIVWERDRERASERAIVCVRERENK